MQTTLAIKLEQTAVISRTAFSGEETQGHVMFSQDISTATQSRVATMRKPLDFHPVFKLHDDVGKSPLYNSGLGKVAAKELLRRTMA